MALIPFAEKKLIAPGSNDPYIIPIGIILHVDAGNVADLYDYFRYRSGGIESHGHIRKDGHLYQYRDTSREADANYRANSFIGHDGRRYGFLSFETQGLGAGKWTDEQLATIKRVIEWGNDEHGIPMRVAPEWNAPGIGYHTMFGAPGPWTPVAKSCPGPDRIKQFNTIIKPWLAEPEEDDMPYSDWPKKDKDALVNDVAKAVRKEILQQDLFPKKEFDLTVRQALAEIWKSAPDGGGESGGGSGQADLTQP